MTHWTLSAKERIVKRSVSATTITTTRRVSETIASARLKPRERSEGRDIVHPFQVPERHAEVAPRGARVVGRDCGDGDDPEGVRREAGALDRVGDLVRAGLLLHDVGP